MKYPQLVSTRAVNAISDWLVSRLEQIGVEAPLIYSRLLLSLLHSSVQINDPIEFSNLEKYFTNQKGNNKRFPPCDTEKIKKFTAIQCLLDAVSTEQEISCIENLVDELFEKLIDLEKQSKNEEETFIHHQLPSSIKSLDIEDPRKRYYRAFPALSKEMEDSVWLAKCNDKSLIWPTSNSGTSSANNMVALNATAGVKRKNKRRRNQALNKGRMSSVRKNSYGGNSSPTWDTDFEGNWEMGTDLIKEFLMSQKNRNRSISESDASHFIYEKNSEKRMKPANQENNMKSSDHLHQMSGVATNNLNILSNKPGVPNNRIAKKDINITGNNNIDDDMHEYVLYNELISFKDFDSMSDMTRHMYQDNISYDDVKSSKEALEDQQNDFAQFEAKFNSDVEALWRDNKTSASDNIREPSFELSSNNQRNIDNFWTNYYNHHYNNSVDEKAIHTLFEKNSNDMLHDYYSLPSNFGTFQSKIDKNSEMLTGDHDLSSVGVFISDSIWSDKASTTSNAYNEEDSFYNNGWAPKNCEQATDTYDDKEIPNAFNISKWSECSFETPFIPTSATLNAPTSIGLAGQGKHLYCGGFKHAVAGTTTNKTVGPNSLFHQTSQHHAHNQVTQPVSLPDYYGSSLCCFASEKQKITSAMIPPQLQQTVTASTTSSTTTTTTARTVSLTNHSKTSGFIEYSIVKSSSSLFQFNQIAKFDRKTIANNQNRSAMPLTASASSLAPPALVDCSGSALHSAVNNSSASSSSPLDDEDNLLTSYRTHFRPIKQNYADGYQFDISGSLDEVEFERSDSGSLYVESEKYFEYTRVDTFLSDEDSSASSICSLGDDSKFRDVDGVSGLKGLYPLKFRVKQSDKQCQTEDSLQVSVLLQANQVIATKKRNSDNYQPIDQLELFREEVDYSADSDCCLNEEPSIDLNKWTMAEIGKKCVDNNNTHTLWGMCPACTKENKCVPANRLLKDELTIEADEIMSDLKYMQDLYICSDWENEDDDNDTDSELEALKNDEDDDDSGRFGNEDSVNDDDDDNDDNEEQEQIFYNITKLISDLLKPENAKSLVDALSAGAGNQSKNILKGMSSDGELTENANNASSLFDYQKNAMWKNVNNNNNEKYIGGLWSNDENIIWKREMKPWSNWPRLNDNKTTTFLEKLNWEHANLAAIWKNGSVSGGGEKIKSSSSSLIEKMAKPVENSVSDIIAPPPNAPNQSKVHRTSCAEESIQVQATVRTNPINRNTNNPISWNISPIDAAELVAQRRYHKHPINCCSMSSQTTATNRPDRKRRHSASQNISCSGSCSNDSGRVALEWCVAGDREMTAKIGGCNKVEIMAKWESDSSKLPSLINVDDSLSSSSSLSPKTTIITCKYWTTMDTTLASPYFMDKNSLYNGIGAMAMNPSSILRHVAVVSRPLTR